MGVMDVMFRDEQPTVRFGETFVASEGFKMLFRELRPLRLPESYRGPERHRRGERRARGGRGRRQLPNVWVRRV